MQPQPPPPPPGYPMLPGAACFRPLGLGPPPGFPMSLGPGAHVQPRRKNATRETTMLLKQWLNQHKRNPYPTKNEKIFLAVVTCMSLTQVSTWFANARRRLKKENKMTWSPRNRCDDDEDDDNDDDDNDDDTDNLANDENNADNDQDQDDQDEHHQSQQQHQHQHQHPHPHQHQQQTNNQQQHNQHQIHQHQLPSHHLHLPLQVPPLPPQALKQDHLAANSQNHHQLPAQLASQNQSTSLTGLPLHPTAAAAAFPPTHQFHPFNPYHPLYQMMAAQHAAMQAAAAQAQAHARQFQHNEAPDLADVKPNSILWRPYA